MIFIFAFIFSFGFQFSAQASDLLEAAAIAEDCQISLSTPVESEQIGLSESKFVELIELYQFRLKRLAFVLTKNPEDAKDLLQDTYLRLWAFRKLFMVDMNFERWALKFMSNAFISNYRRYRRHEHEDIDSVPEDVFAADIGTQESHIAALEMGDVFSTLSYRNQQALLDIIFHELKYEEVAPTFNLTPGGLKALVNRARVNLRGKYPD